MTSQHIKSVDPVEVRKARKARKVSNLLCVNCYSSVCLCGTFHAENGFHGECDGLGLGEE